MAHVSQFEDMLTWQRARELNKELHKLFGTCRDYSFRDQIFRAGISIMNNISEGFERGTDKEFRQFLFVAKGSAGEVMSMLYPAIDCGYLTQEGGESYIKECTEISKMLSAFIKYLSKRAQ